MRTRYAWVLTALGIAGGAAPAHGQSPLADLGWLGGCWEARSGSRLVEEHWMAPRGGRMLGLSRTTRESTVVEYEWMSIVSGADGRVAYEAHPSGQSPAVFPAVRITASEAAFGNPDHDFPQRIEYARLSKDSVVATVSGQSRGAPRQFQIRYARVACPGTP